MGQLGSKMRRIVGGLAHWCPACDEMHAFALAAKNSDGAQWEWDGNVENPTFTPSMNITVNSPAHPHYDPDEPTEVCHYYLQNGVIQYLADCTHGLKNQRIVLPPLPAHLRDPVMTSDRDV